MVLDPLAEFIAILIVKCHQFQLARMRVGTSSPSLCAKALNMVFRFCYGYRATYTLKPYALRALCALPFA